MTWKRKKKGQRKKNRLKNRKVFKYKNPLIFDDRAYQSRL